MRTIELALSDFPSTPTTLLDEFGKPATSITLSIKELFHHYWLAKYGDAPRSNVFEYEAGLTAGPEWRMKGAGIGADTESRRNVSNELGKAFARWFLYTHLGHTYFCPFEIAMARSQAGPGHQWSRREPGDLPDYVCGTSSADINLLEAKGRYSSVTFDTKEFGDFRKQLGRARLCDAAGKEIAVKGFISAARWGTEDKPKVKSKLWIEDPWTDGERIDRYPGSVGTSMILGHYVSIFRRLQLPVIADSLQFGFPLSQRQTGARRGVWICRAGPLAGRKFVGGIIPIHGIDEYWPHHYDGWERNPFVLLPPMQFFGLEAATFATVIDAARSGTDGLLRLEPVGVPEPLGSISLLRDGSIRGPASYFEAIDVYDVDG